MRIALAQINPIIGSLSQNASKIIDTIHKCRNRGVKIVVFPEMALLGYPPEDLLLLPKFIERATYELQMLIKEVKNITAIIGCVRKNPYGGEKFLYNSAAIIQNGELIGFQDKSLLPDYDVFSERRYFEPAARTDVWSLEGKRVAVTICEDIWQHAGAVEYSDYIRDPVKELALQDPDFLINLSASPFYVKRHEMRIKVCSQAAKTLNCPVFYCNQVGGNDSLIFDGYSMVMDQNGEILKHAKGFEEDLLIYDTDEKTTPTLIYSDPIQDLYAALILGVKDYFHKLGFSKACLGLSGGIDSAVVACIAKEALGEKNVLALSLPSRFTSNESLEDAERLTQNLKLEIKTISIENVFQSYLETLKPYSFGNTIGIAEENLQSRIRGTLLMAFSNKYGCIVLGTGNKSEMAMGYATLYGDMCGGLQVISDVTKRQIYELAKWINKEREIIPARILEKAPSAELRPNQKDTDSLPEYSIVDAVLVEYIEEHKSIEEIVQKWNLPLRLVQELVQKIHFNEYKRRQAPPGLRVTKKAFTTGRRFPIVQHWNTRYR